MKRILRFSFMLVILVAVVSFNLCVGAQSNIAYTTYTYDHDGNPVASPHAYTPSKIYSASDFGLSQFTNPNDLCVDADGNIYVADTGNARVVKINSDLKTANEIKKFSFGDKEYEFTAPTGLFVTENGDLYVADSTGLNIYKFNKDLVCTAVVGAPNSSVLPEDFSYIPSKIAVDNAGRMYVVSIGNTYGVIALNKDGNYSTFIGAQKVSVSGADKLWRKFMTKEQKKRTLSFVPTNYNNINIDEKGFLYVTATYSDINAVIRSIVSRSTENRYAMIKKLNSAGEDVLIRNGSFPPAGDVKISLASTGNATNTDINYGPSSIVDSALGEDNVYSIADQKRGKIFTYDVNGNLLFAFGGSGYQSGLFRNLCAIDYSKNGELVALDQTSGSFTVFVPTQYGKLVKKAIHLTANRKYAESVPVYKEILLENANFDIANIGIGTAMYREGNYSEAMKYYKLANDVDNYSVAYSEYRSSALGNYFLLIPLFIVILCFAVSKFFGYVGKYNKKVLATGENRNTFKSEILYGFYVIFHPFDGFWDLKRSKRGSLRGATTILALAVISLLFRQVGMGYIYTGKTEVDVNIFVNLAVILAVVAIWCISNWCLASLMYGEGSLKDVYIASCYALLPLVFFTIPATLLSNFVAQNELMFVNVLFAISYIWVAILLFGAVLSTHDYQAGTNFFAIILTIVGMIIIVFLIMLFVNLIGQMIGFVSNIYNEISFRT